jgi:Na+/H+ antiporter NhaD/arsenite permease-like protein
LLQEKYALSTLPLWSAIPFAGLLLSIALWPLLSHHIWERHYGKIAAAWALLFIVPYVIVSREAGVHEILHSYLKEYIPFIILLWSLYTVSGGIMIDGFPRGTPFSNTAVLGFGTLIASWFGTTGAAMLLIRPQLRMNRQRQTKVHIVVFFIILVCNIGGALTPLGDPPLLLGFLAGVPFFWTLRLFPHMVAIAVPVLALFFCVDLFLYRRELRGKPPVLSQQEENFSYTVSIRGIGNVFLLICIVSATVLSGAVSLGEYTILGVQMSGQALLRDGVLIAIGLISFFTTGSKIREKNGFSWHPIQEVAILFAAIFVTIIPLLDILRAGAHGPMAPLLAQLTGPCRYFWACGLLSSVLDNAPTYLSFFNTGLGVFGAGLSDAEALKRLLTDRAVYLEAISCGAVFMGALTYIGNAPNFLVKAIAEQNGISMPGFFAFLLYAGLILVPGFVLVARLFF